MGLLKRPSMARQEAGMYQAVHLCSTRRQDLGGSRCLNLRHSLLAQPLLDLADAGAERVPQALQLS